MQSGHDDSAERVASMVLGHLQALGVEYRTEDGVCCVASGTTAVYVSVASFADGTVVHVVAPVLDDVDEDPAKLTRLLHLNPQLLFGRFGYDSEHRRVNIEYDLFGETLDVEELSNALRVVGHLADEWDEQLQQLLGGRRPHVD